MSGKKLIPDLPRRGELKELAKTQIENPGKDSADILSAILCHSRLSDDDFNFIVCEMGLSETGNGMRLFESAVFPAYFERSVAQFARVNNIQSWKVDILVTKKLTDLMEALKHSNILVRSAVYARSDLLDYFGSEQIWNFVLRNGNSDIYALFANEQVFGYLVACRVISKTELPPSLWKDFHRLEEVYGSSIGQQVEFEVQVEKPQKLTMTDTE